VHPPGNVERRGAVRTKIFSGWKDIAHYLGRGVRTVQRYERDCGLPVHRPSGKTQGSVVATRSELDAWVASRVLGRPRSPIATAIPQAFISLKQRIAEMHELSKGMMRLRLEIREISSETRKNLK
jgi:hypothetical protein